MKVLLFGGSGQLGREIVQRGAAFQAEIAAPHEMELDLGARDRIAEVAEREQPDVVINAAAYTAVDKAEEERESAYAVNCTGAAHVAEAARGVGARLLHVSTDYVFGDAHSTPINEEAEPQPINVYGASKLAGEQEVLQILGAAALIVRTSYLHGQYGHNLVHAMINQFKEKETVRGVNDQHITPTWAGWLAEVLLRLGSLKASGVVHACAANEVTPFEFSAEILRIVGPALGKADVQLEPVGLEYFGDRPARRARYSVMDTERLGRLLGGGVIRWQEGLWGHLRDLGYVVEAGATDCVGQG